MASVKCILAEQGGKGGGAAVQVGSITITTPPTKTSYLAGDTFNPVGMVVTASYTLDGVPFSESEVTGSCTFSPSPLVDGTTHVVVSYTDGNGVTVTTSQAVTVTHKLVSIAATTLPTKVTYEYGDTLATAGLVVTATYSDNQTAAISASCSPTALNTVGTQTITATYTENGVTKTCTFQVTVNRKTITVPTWKGTLTYNGSQQSADNTSLWNNFTTNMTIGGTTTGTNAGDYSASFTPSANYRWPDGTTTAKSVTWSIGVLSIAVPTANTTSFTYNGNTQGPTFTYNSTYVTAGGDSSVKTNAGNYTATFTLKSTTNTKWSDNTTAAKSIGWSIAKANGSVTLSVASVAISSSNYSSGVAVTVTRNGDGAVSCSTAPTGITISVSGTTITVKGNGSTAVSETSITVTVAEGTNYKSATTTLKVSATYWVEPTNGSTPTNAWWTGLSDSIQGLTDTQLQAMVGKELSITLSSAVLGTTTHKVVCIGYNLDRDKNNTSRKTLTFQTLNCLAQTTVFGSSNASWNGSTVRTQCQNYYNALPFKSAVKTVSKGTCTAINSSQSGTPTYQDETVFLPSDCEMGFPAGHDYSNGKGYAASYDEFCQQNTSKTAYQYYNSNTRRIKKLGDSGSAQYYWERSLRYNDANYACYVRSDGKPSDSGYNGSLGFAPAFVI